MPLKYNGVILSCHHLKKDERKYSLMLLYTRYLAYIPATRKKQIYRQRKNALDYSKAFSELKNNQKSSNESNNHFHSNLGFLTMILGSPHK